VVFSRLLWHTESQWVSQHPLSPRGRGPGEEARSRFPYPVVVWGMLYSPHDADFSRLRRQKEGSHYVSRRWIARRI